MVFVLQNSQNKDSLAIHLKLNEIIRATENSRNQLVGLEEAEHEETKQLQAEFKQIRDEDCNSSKEGKV
jgi:low affinity Fe/Cu permease